jgi:hypothetical protein
MWPEGSRRRCRTQRGGAARVYGHYHHRPCPRSLALPQIAKVAYKNKRFAAIDRAISRNGLKFVMLLRLSPLLPLAASNYLYGLTSVDVGSYVLGSWLGMLPGACWGCG